MSDEYKTQCDKCGHRTWYETEQPCTMSYPKKCHCDAGHVHTYPDGRQEKCGGTLRVIDYSGIRTHLIIGERYTFRDKAGTVKRYTLGRTTGHRPALLLLHNARSISSGNIVRADQIKYRDGLYECETYFI